MPGLGDTVFDLAQIRRMAAGALGGASPLSEVAMTASNPGALGMFVYAPPGLPRGAPLVVALHGCGQSARAYDTGTGWSTLAARHGFAVLLPEQRSANNGGTCFNWFQSQDITRDGGEVLSIRQMVAQAIETHALDAARVFVTGLSAGGAMTAALLATYPDVFAGGAIIAGLPYGVAHDVSSAMTAMRHTPTRTADDWGDLVRQAGPDTARRLAVQIWHGTADTVVHPSAAEELTKQWVDVLGIAGAPNTDVVDGATHTVWRDAGGRIALERYLVPGLAHGLPLRIDAALPDEAVGKPAPFMLDAGISSTWRIANAWGVLGAPTKASAASATPDTTSASALTRSVGDTIRQALRAAGLSK